jgi:hypothetical protein
MATLLLSGSVGTGSAKKGLPHNAAADVTAIRDRLVELGYDWISAITSGTDKDFIRTIKLFQSICAGHPQFDAGDGRIDVEGGTHRWLAAENAPGWVKIAGKSGVGWQNTNDFDVDNGGFTTTWMRDAISAAGVAYQLQLITLRLPLTGFGMLLAKDAPPMWVRECSPKKGGHAKGHGSHQTGLDVDMRLPLLSPDHLKWTDLGNNGFKDKRFNRIAAELQLTAIKAAMKPKLVLFNDPEFIRKRLCTKHVNHDQHYHIRISPPERKDGAYSAATLAGQIVKPLVDAFSPLF